MAPDNDITARNAKYIKAYYSVPLHISNSTATTCNCHKDIPGIYHMNTNYNSVKL